MSTITKTYTVTDAKYLGSKIAADLRQLQIFYGSPSDTDINAYVEEFVLLLKEGYLQECSYGFKKNGTYVVGVQYKVSEFGTIDDNPGRMPVGVDITGASWASYLIKNSKYADLSNAEKQKVDSSLPVKRVSGSDPCLGANASQDKTYSSGSINLNRTTFK
jgi:hypothetical protein